MNPDTTFGQPLDRGAHVHRIAAEPVELRHDQNVTFFHLDEQLRKPRPLIGAYAPRNAFRHNAALVDREAGRFYLA